MIVMTIIMGMEIAIPLAAWTGIAYAGTAE